MAQTRSKLDYLLSKQSENIMAETGSTTGKVGPNVTIHTSRTIYIPRFYQPDLGSELDSPFARDGNTKLVRRGYWLDMNDRSLVLVMTQGIGAHLTNDEKRAHLTDLRRAHLIDQVCIQEILPPEGR